MVEVVGQVGASLVIPMHYVGAGPLASFLDLVRDRYAVVVSEAPSVTLCGRRCRRGGRCSCSLAAERDLRPGVQQRSGRTTFGAAAAQPDVIGAGDAGRTPQPRGAARRGPQAT